MPLKYPEASIEATAWIRTLGKFAIDGRISAQVAYDISNASGVLVRELLLGKDDPFLSLADIKIAEQVDDANATKQGFPNAG